MRPLQPRASVAACSAGDASTRRVAEYQNRAASGSAATPRRRRALSHGLYGDRARRVRRACGDRRARRSDDVAASTSSLRRRRPRGRRARASPAARCARDVERAGSATPQPRLAGGRTRRRAHRGRALLSKRSAAGHAEVDSPARASATLCRAQRICAELRDELLSGREGCTGALVAQMSFRRRRSAGKSGARLPAPTAATLCRCSTSRRDLSRVAGARRASSLLCVQLRQRSGSSDCAQLGLGARLELPHPLARDAEHRAELLERRRLGARGSAATRWRARAGRARRAPRGSASRALLAQLLVGERRSRGRADRRRCGRRASRRCRRRPDRRATGRAA